MKLFDIRAYLRLHMKRDQFNVALSCKVNTSPNLGTLKEDRQKLMKRHVSSGKTWTVNHVQPAADNQLIQQTSITFSDSKKA